ncbi:hypothetical protein CPB83DRAFT_854807 [Crepidotus variabilis]|uniref:Uncharacterized protein n=1 Tax=Crepidotus variabilis TaxID=179855 RepID=A0A9P6EFW1_9AGAR|nr:hypothetical protein CPB83DRAFT_854807 [Crepidotus variabilis]
MSPLPTHKKFNAENADIVVQSCSSSPQTLLIELESFQQFPHEVARNFCREQCKTAPRCVYAAEIVQLCKDGLEGIQKFSDYLPHRKIKDGSG